MGSILSLPELPRWIVQMNRTEEASETLSNLQDTSRDWTAVESAMREIQESLVISGRGSLKDLLKMGPQRIANSSHSRQL